MRRSSAAILASLACSSGPTEPTDTPGRWPGDDVELEACIEVSPRQLLFPDLE